MSTVFFVDPPPTRGAYLEETGIPQEEEGTAHVLWPACSFPTQFGLLVHPWKEEGLNTAQ